MKSLYLSAPVVPCYDNSEPPIPPAGAPVPTTPQSPANPGRAFTQEDVNRLLADDRRKHQAKIDQIQRTLEEVSASKSLTSQEREQLLTQIEAMEAEKRTKEQQLAHEKSQLEKQHAKALADEKKNVESWRKRFEATTIDHALLDAAHRSDAFNADQIVRLLKPSTRIVERTDERGKGIGDYEVVVDLPDTDDNGSPLIRTLSPSETLKTMQGKLNVYGNLFKSGVVSGIGSGSGTGTAMSPGGKINARNLTQDQYMEIRAKNPELLGLRPNKKGHR